MATKNTSIKKASSKGKEGAKSTPAKKQMKGASIPKKEKQMEETPAPKKKKEVQERKNGYSHPKAGGKTAQVWEICDKLLKKNKGERPKRSEALEEGQKQGLEPGTIKTQYSRWKTYHGLK